MTPEHEALARRAVACKGWRWMAGMRTLGGTVHTRPVVVLVADSLMMPVEWAAPPSDAHRHEVISAYGNPGWRDVNWERALPDLEDPATLGCLLALVREAQDEPQAVAVYDPEDDRWLMIGALDPEWGIRDLLPGRLFVGLTEAAALVAALEAAP